MMRKIFSHQLCLSPACMVEIVYLLRDGRAHAGDTLQVFQRGSAHLARRAKMKKQRAFSRGADAGDLVQR